MFECGEGREIYKQPKHFKVRRNRLLLLTKYALLVKRPTNSGIARPPLFFREMPEIKRRFSLDVISKGLLEEHDIPFCFAAVPEHHNGPC